MSTTQSNPERSLGPGAWISAAFLLTVFVIGAVVYLNRDAQPAPTSQNIPAVTTQNPSPQAANTAIPTTAPQVQWENFEGALLPYSPIYGPKNRQSPIFSGYSRTPTGALIALTQIAYRMPLSRNGGWKEVTEQQVLPGKGREFFMKQRPQMDESQINSINMAQLAGFRFVTWSPDVAVIQIAGTEDRGYAIRTSTVKWVNGDWKLELRENGSTSTPPQLATNLDGFIPWSASNA